MKNQSSEVREESRRVLTTVTDRETDILVIKLYVNGGTH